MSQERRGAKSRLSDGLDDELAGGPLEDLLLELGLQFIIIIIYKIFQDIMIQFQKFYPMNVL